MFFQVWPGTAYWRCRWNQLLGGVNVDQWWKFQKERASEGRPSQHCCVFGTKPGVAPCTFAGHETNNDRGNHQSSSPWGHCWTSGGQGYWSAETIRNQLITRSSSVWGCGLTTLSGQRRSRTYFWRQLMSIIIQSHSINPCRALWSWMRSSGRKIIVQLLMFHLEFHGCWSCAAKVWMFSISIVEIYFISNKIAVKPTTK